MHETARRWIEAAWLPFSLCAILALCVAASQVIGGDWANVTLTEMLIRLIIVVGMYIFIGNSGIMSFGHIGFMCIGAYATAWATCDPMWKQMMLGGLPDFLQQADYPFLVAVAMAATLAAAVGLLFGLAVMRLSGIAASIATFAFLVVVNNIYSNWNSVTGGTSSIVGIPTYVGPWTALAFACLSIVAACIFQRSHIGLMLRASRDDEIAAKASAVDIARVRLIAFVASAFLVGAGGSLYGHFLGILTADMFYLGLTFITLAMLVVGGVGSLTGAVVGVLVVTFIIEGLRLLEGGFVISGTTIALPQGSQEIGLGIVMAAILIFRASGLAGGGEFAWPFRKRRARRALGA